MRKNITTSKNTKKWQQDIDDDQEAEDLLKKIRPEDLKADDDGKQEPNIDNSEQKQQVRQFTTKQGTNEDKAPKKKKKEFAWMSDSDQQMEKPKPTPEPITPIVQVDRVDPPLPEVDIYVTKLPIKATEADLQKHFSKSGNVLEIYLPTNEGTGLNKGKAFLKIQITDEEFFDKEHKIKGEVVQVSSGYGSKGKDIQYAEKRERSRSRSRDK